MAVTSQDEFVDLYEILELATDAEAETIRKRINELYLEAQQNLDHRNAKKRLQYQQMYEIFLPQARHLLLDKRRREEYDRYLNAYRTGNKVVTAEPSTPSVSMPETSSQTEEPPLPGMAEVEVDPEVLAAEREDIWAKWKQGLELIADDAPAVPAPLADRAAAAQEASPQNQEVAPTPVTPNSAPARPDVPPFAQRPQSAPRPAAPPPRTTSDVPSSPSGAARQAPPPPRAARPKRPPSVGYGAALAGEPTPEEVERAKEHERHLELQRAEITREAAQTAGLLSAAVGGVIIFIVGCIGLFFLVNNLKEIPLGLSSGVFSGILLLVILGAAAFGASRMRDRAENSKEVELSQLSHEELLRQYRSK
jgi:uncharacterized integral membrane protein